MRKWAETGRGGAWLWLCLAAGCSEISEPQVVVRHNVPDNELFVATVRFSRAGQPRFDIHADRITQDNRSRVTHFDGVRADFYNHDGGHSALLTAREGLALEAEERLVARGSVVVKSDSGLVLRTEELNYDRRRERVHADGFVTVVTRDDSLSGYGFNAAPDLSDWSIENTSGTTSASMKDKE